MSLAVLSILGVILAGMTNQSFRLMTLGENQARTLQTLRIVSRMIGQDLQSAVFPLVATNTTSFHFIQFTPSSSPGLPGYQNRDAIFWQTAVVGDSTNSDVACVGYFVMWDKTNPANPQAKLCRFYDTSQDTANYFAYTNANWITSSLIQNVAPGTQASNFQGMLAPNIIGFWVDFEAPPGQNFTQPFDSRAETNRPTDAILSYAFLDASTASRLTSADVSAIQSAYVNYTTNNPSAFVSSLPTALQPAVQIYTTRVPFQTLQ